MAGIMERGGENVWEEIILKLKVVIGLVTFVRLDVIVPIGGADLGGPSGVCPPLFLLR